MKFALKSLSLVLCFALAVSFAILPVFAATDGAGGNTSATTAGSNPGGTADPAVPTTVMTVQSDLSQVCPGDTVTVTVSLPENSGIVSGVVTLSFDNTKLTYVSAEAGALLTGTTYAIDALASSVVLTRAPAAGLTPIAAAGPLLIARFTAKEGAEGQTLAVTLSASDVKGATGDINLNLEQKASFYVNCKAHDYEGTAVVAGPNCLQPKTSTQHCKRCNKDIVTELAPALGHAWGAWTVVTPATCAAPGKQTHVCSNAGCPVGTETVDIPALPHTWAPDMPIVTPPSCNVPGVGTGTCTVCKTVQPVELPALGHAHAELEVLAPATCLETGFANVVCSRCKERLSLILPPTGHNVTEWVISDDVKCMQPGVRKGTCQNCKQVIEEYLEQMAHVYGSPEIVKPATETEYGEQKVTCSRCGETAIQLIPPIVIDPITGLPITTDGIVFPTTGGSYTGPGIITTDVVDGESDKTSAGAASNTTSSAKDSSGIDTWIVILVGGVMLFIICLALILFFLLKKKIDHSFSSDSSEETLAGDTAGAVAVAAVAGSASGETSEESENSEEPNGESSAVDDGGAAVVAAVPEAEEEKDVSEESSDSAEESDDVSEEPADPAAEDPEPEPTEEGAEEEPESDSEAEPEPPEKKEE